MLTATIICPHCNRTDQATFGSLVEFGDREELDEKTVGQIMDFDKKSRFGNAKTDVMPRNRQTRPIADDPLPVAGILICQGCRMPIMATCQMTRIEYINHLKELQSLGSGVANSRFTMDDLKLFPEPKRLLVHQSWPQRVQALMPDIDRMLQQSFDPSIVITTCRTVIDLCTKDLGGEGRNIAGRIENLLSKGVITKPISEWAHKIRSLGADATHDGEGSEGDAQEFAAFLVFFLKAAYELGAEVAEISKEVDQEATSLTAVG